MSLYLDERIQWRCFHIICFVGEMFKRMPFTWAHKKISDNIATWTKKRLKFSLNWCSQNDFDYRYRHFSLTGIHENRSFHVPYHKHKICFDKVFFLRIHFTDAISNIEWRFYLPSIVKVERKKTWVPVDRKRRVNGKSSTFLCFEWHKNGSSLRMTAKKGFDLHVFLFCDALLLTTTFSWMISVEKKMPFWWYASVRFE